MVLSSAVFDSNSDEMTILFRKITKIAQRLGLRPKPLMSRLAESSDLRL